MYANILRFLKRAPCLDHARSVTKYMCNESILAIAYTVEPRYKEVGYYITKPSHNKVILLVPAVYISLFFYPDIMRNLI